MKLSIIIPVRNEEILIKKRNIEEVKAQRDALKSDESLKKYAREKYLFKKKNEDVYILQ